MMFRPAFSRFSRFSRPFCRPRQYSVAIAPVNPKLIKRIGILAEEFEQLQLTISNGKSFDSEVSKKYSTLSTILDLNNQYTHYLQQINDLVTIIEENDVDLLEDAQEELTEIIPQLNAVSTELSIKLLPPLKYTENATLMELRPGVGGVEAMIFTQNLFDMYVGFAQTMRWNYQVISQSYNSSGNGLVEAVISIDELGSFDVLRHESGVHRVQRIPDTETKGRTHTSTAAVVVLPKMSEGTEASVVEDERSFLPDEIRIDIMRASGKGGQHVNTTDSAVRLTHYPSGIVISIQDERSQHRNKAKAFQILRSKLAEIDRQKEIDEQRKLRTDQVTTTDRSDKIRTYNYVQNRVTDHRCGHSIFDIDGMMTGERLQEMIEQVSKQELEERMEAL